MAGTAVRGRLTWQVAAVTGVTPETPTVRTIELDVPDWAGHRAGQHLDIRLTAEDGYRAERSYSIAAAPGEPVAITVERLADGEVSPYLTDELRAGDELELRGPIGGYFVWDADPGDGPLLLVAGGSGVVPLRSILRHRQRSGSSVPARLLYSARSQPELIYHRELDGYHDVPVTYTLTRDRPP
ncbi:MAG TPA: FAD-binding oxidoreductase, partial [Streptosporangiaceae bacterium]